MSTDRITLSQKEQKRLLLEDLARLEKEQVTLEPEPCKYSVDATFIEPEESFTIFLTSTTEERSE